MKSMELAFVGKEFEIRENIFVKKEDGSNDISKKLFSVEKKYKAIAISDIPNPHCVLVANDFGFYDFLHISHIKILEEHK